MKIEDRDINQKWNLHHVSTQYKQWLTIRVVLKTQGLVNVNHIKNLPTKASKWTV